MYLEERVNELEIKAKALEGYIRFLEKRYMDFHDQLIDLEEKIKRRKICPCSNSSTPDSSEEESECRNQEDSSDSSGYPDDRAMDSDESSASGFKM